MSDREAFEKWWPSVGQTIGKVAAWEAWQAALQSGEPVAEIQEYKHWLFCDNGERDGFEWRKRQVNNGDLLSLPHGTKLYTASQPVVDADAKREAETLAMALWSKWYKDDSPDFELCDSVAGVITQINNMTTGLVREDVSWGVYWGRSGDRSCVSICKSFPDGSLEIVATEFSPHTTPQAVVTDELTGKQWSAMRTVIQEHAEKFRSADTYEMASAYMDAAPEAVYQALLSAGKGAA